MTPDAALAASAAVPSLPAAYNRMDMHRDFMRAFATDEGRRVLGHILAWAEVWSPFAPRVGYTASEALLIFEGRRQIGLEIMRNIEVALQPHDEGVRYGGRSVDSGKVGGTAAGTAGRRRI